MINLLIPKHIEVIIRVPLIIWFVGTSQLRVDQMGSTFNVVFFNTNLKFLGNKFENKGICHQVWEKTYNKLMEGWSSRHGTVFAFYH